MTDPIIVVQENDRILVRDEPDKEVLVVREPERLVVDPNAESTVVKVTEQERIAVTAPGPRGVRGLPGEQGPAGQSANANYIHYQEVPTDQWIIDHPLGFHPNVTVVDTANTEVEGDLMFVSSTRVIVTFGSPFAGKAYLS